MPFLVARSRKRAHPRKNLFTYSVNLHKFRREPLQMTILVHDATLRELCTSRGAATHKLGSSVGTKLIQRICELRAVNSIQEFQKFYARGIYQESPPPDPTFKVRIWDTVSLLIRPATPTQSNDWTTIKEIELVKLIQ
jgi:hypothetical protein